MGPTRVCRASPFPEGGNSSSSRRCPSSPCGSPHTPRPRCDRSRSTRLASWRVSGATASPRGCRVGRTVIRRLLARWRWGAQPHPLPNPLTNPLTNPRRRRAAQVPPRGVPARHALPHGPGTPRARDRGMSSRCCSRIRRRRHRSRCPRWMRGRRPSLRAPHPRHPHIHRARAGIVRSARRMTRCAGSTRRLAMTGAARRRQPGNACCRFVRWIPSCCVVISTVHAAGSMR